MQRKHHTKTYITPDMLQQLNHSYSTPTNEAMNTSVAVYPPKSKTYSQNDSLNTCVVVAGSIQVKGYVNFRQQVFNEFGFSIDANLRIHLETRDKVKAQKQKNCKIIKVKKARSEQKYATYNKSVEDYLVSIKAGMCYETGVAVATAKKSLKDTVKDKNWPGTAQEDFIYIYHHPLYYKNQGHTLCRSPLYVMKTKIKEERSVATKFIANEAIETELRRAEREGGMSCLFSCLSILYLVYY